MEWDFDPNRTNEDNEKTISFQFIYNHVFLYKKRWIMIGELSPVKWSLRLLNLSFVSRLGSRWLVGFASYIDAKVLVEF